MELSLRPQGTPAEPPCPPAPLPPPEDPSAYSRFLCTMSKTTEHQFVKICSEQRIFFVSWALDESRQPLMHKFISEKVNLKT